MFSWLNIRKRQRKRRVKERLNAALADLMAAGGREPRDGSLDLLFSTAENENWWKLTVLTMVEHLLDSHPLSLTLIAYLVGNFPIQSMDVTFVVSQKMNRKIKRVEYTASQCRNATIVWAILAEKMAGDLSARLLTDDLCSTLFTLLQDSSRPLIQLHALVALEKFAMTNVNKEKIIARGIVSVLQGLEKQQSEGVDVLKHQLKYCAKWSLDNIFPSEGRDFSIDRKKMRPVKVMLNKSDTSGYLKLPRHGLEARNDALTFESIRATCCVTDGSWYYEVTICSSGIMQIGWATKHCQFEPQEGSGVGDDSNSFGYDGCRRRVWHRGAGEEYGTRKWKPGDVVGVHLDITEGAMSFSLNGENQGNAFDNFPSPPDIQEIAQEGLYPAVSFMTSEHCIFNFGHKPFRHPPDAKFRALNFIGTLKESEKIILPRLAQPRPTSATFIEFDDKEPLCQICYEKPPNALLNPCGHRGLCFRCALQLLKCPICRKDIEERKILSQLFTHAPQGDIISRPQSPTIKELAEMSANESESEEAEMKFSASVLSFDGPSSPKARGKN